MVTGRPRILLVKLHQLIGLGFGALFVLLGLTGTVLVWRDEIDAALNPQLLRASVALEAPVSPAAVQAVTRMLEGDPRYGRPKLLMLPLGPRDVFIAWYPLKVADTLVVPPHKGKPRGLSFATARSRQVMIDPGTLAVKGERIWGEPGLSRPQLMPTLFHLHHYLLAGEAGKTLLGVTGLFLLIGVALGIALWWPRARLRALAQAFRISHGGSWPRLCYTLHRTAGVVAAPVLLVTAFSGWYLNLPKWVTPLVASVMTVTPHVPPVPDAVPPDAAPIGPAEAMRRAQALFPGAAVSRLAFPKPSAPSYEVRLRQPGEVRQGGGGTRVWLDAVTGAPLVVRDPLTGGSGDKLLYWMYPLHTGEAFGMAGRVVISVLGAMPLLLALTGLRIWWKRRQGHRRHLERTAGQPNRSRREREAGHGASRRRGQRQSTVR